MAKLYENRIPHITKITSFGTCAKALTYTPWWGVYCVYMKTKDSPLSVFKALLIITLFFAGVPYIFAAWTGPDAAPPGNNVAAPINISSVDQDKAGGLSLGKLAVNGQVQIKDGTQGAGKVLTSDVDGVASWVTPGSSGNNGNQPLKLIYMGLNGATASNPNVTVPIPAGITHVVINARATMSCTLPEDKGRSVKATFKANGVNYANLTASSGNNNGAEVRIEAATIGAIAVSGGTDLVLTASKYLLDQTGTVIAGGPWAANGGPADSKCSTVAPYFFGGFYGYVIYGY